MSVRSRTVIARLGTAALLSAAALALTAPAHAQHSPFTPIPQAPPQQTAPPQEELESDADDGLSSTQQLLIGLAGLVLLLGIGLAIVRDARQAAPAGERPAPLRGDDPSPKGSRRPPKQRAAKSRAKAKTARQARKRNR